MDDNQVIYTARVCAVPVSTQDNIYGANYNLENDDPFKLSVFERIYIIKIKKCLFYENLCSLRKINNEWILNFYDNYDNKYKFSVSDSNNLYTILLNLGLYDINFQIILVDNNNKKLNSIKMNSLYDMTEWCYYTEKQLENVQLYTRTVL